MVEEARSDLDAEVQKIEKQMKQLEILPSDVEQLAKVHIHVPCSCVCVCVCVFVCVLSWEEMTCAVFAWTMLANSNMSPVYTLPLVLCARLCVKFSSN